MLSEVGIASSNVATITVQVSLGIFKTVFFEGPKEVFILIAVS